MGARRGGVALEGGVEVKSRLGAWRDASEGACCGSGLDGSGSRYLREHVIVITLQAVTVALGRDPQRLTIHITGYTSTSMRNQTRKLFVCDLSYSFHDHCGLLDISILSNQHGPRRIGFRKIKISAVLFSDFYSDIFTYCFDLIPWCGCSRT